MRSDPKNALLAAVLVVALAIPAGPAAARKPKTRHCFGEVATIVGTPRADTLRGTPGPDVIVGLSGDDTISGRGGNDLLCGGPGGDVLSGGAGTDRLRGGPGIDLCLSGEVTGSCESLDEPLALPPELCIAGGDSAPGIEAFLASVPRGSTVQFPEGASCRVEVTLDLGVAPAGEAGRTDTSYDLNGATIFRAHEPSCPETRFCNGPLIDLTGVSGVALFGGSVVGGLVRGTEPDFDPTRATNHGVEVHESSQVLLSDLTIRNVGGDCVDVDGQGDGGGRKEPVPSVDVTIMDSVCDGAGRQGISGGAVDGLLIQGVTFDWIARSGVDLEPGPSKDIRNVTIRDNTFIYVSNFAVAGVGAGDVWENVVVEGNLQLGCPAQVPEANCFSRGFLFVGNSLPRGPLTVVDNVVNGESTIKHTSGKASGNAMTGNPKSTDCMFTLIDSPEFTASENTPVKGVDEVCRFSAAP